MSNSSWLHCTAELTQGHVVTTRPLSNDDLGDKGESRFRELCAGLTANQVTRDRAGFDYIVDFRLPDSLKGLDSRPAPISARVQVKTHWSDRDTIRLRLSAAEQLVKHPGPSFICALAVTPTEEPAFERMYLIHCRGEVVERVLKRLREAEAKRQKPNKVWLTLKPSDFSAALEVRPSELKRALESACHSNALTYLSAKDTELRTVGFGPGAHQLYVNFRAEVDEIIDAFLGLAPLDAMELSETHTRFGISLPGDVFPPGPAQLRFSPISEPCEITIRVEEDVYRFKGKSFRGPPALHQTFGRSKVLFRAGLLQIILTLNEPTFTATFKRDPNVALDTARKVSEWRDLYAILGAMTAQGAEISIRSPKVKEPLLLFAQDATSEAGDEWQKLGRLTLASDQVFRRAGKPNAKESLQNLWAAGGDLTTLAAMIEAPEAVTELSIGTDKSIDLPRDKPLEMVLGHAFKVGDRAIAFGLKTNVTAKEKDDLLVWTGQKVELLDVRLVRSSADFETFLSGLPTGEFPIASGLYRDPPKKN